MTNVLRLAGLAVVSSLALAGCATRSDDIAAAYVSPIQYASLGCGQIREEAARLSSRAAQASGAQDRKATSDAIATGVTLVLFWPALFLIDGDGPAAQEVARLKGEMEALEQASVRKGCGVQFEPAA